MAVNARLGARPAASLDSAGPLEGAGPCGEAVRVISAPLTNVDIAALLIRLVVGGTMLAHGWNHAFGGGRLSGTASWFDSIGIRPGRVHALLATLTELGAGALLVLGLLTPLAAAGVVGTMLVALIANHLRNGFFIFRPGEGYEYVLMITVVGFALAALGPGRWSLDHALGIAVGGVPGLLVALVAGGGGAALLLATCWRPGRTEASSGDEPA
ncbi:MAG: DoxX family membrane protein [Streptosporangiales bacterium]|nr:DoxX family membrane protein [Streptosporangiales bacterium]